METPSSERDGPPADLTELRARVRAIEARVQAAAASAEISGLMTDLLDLTQRAHSRADAQSEWRRLTILSGMAECKRGDAPKALELLRQGLAVEPEDADRDQLVRDHYFLASVAGDLKKFDIAAEHYGRAAEVARTAPGFDVSRRLGIRERQGFALHEARRFADAYAVNLALLADGERHYGMNDRHLNTVMINTAQNLYALGRLPEAEHYLERCVAMARAEADGQREQDLLYQLAVIASERMRPAAARAYLCERVARLEQAGTAQQLEAARRVLEHFDRALAMARAGGTVPPAASDESAPPAR
jgi:tetratricopeptide (TPR) repeat protein